MFKGEVSRKVVMLLRCFRNALEKLLGDAE